MEEIGSEFWYVEKTTPHEHWWDNFGNDRRFLFSGRTALYALLDDICNSKKIRSVCRSNYCCESMIIPFIHHNIRVFFYNVALKNESLYPEPEDDRTYDIFYILDYFGYISTSMLELGKKAKSKGSMVIYDCTQSVLSRPLNIALEFDYIYASFRKFSGLLGGGVFIKSSVGGVCHQFEIGLWEGSKSRIHRQKNIRARTQEKIHGRWHW